MTETADLGTLTEINTDDLLSAWGLHEVRFGRRLLRWLVRRPTARFAREIIEFDEKVGASGLKGGSTWLMGRYTGGVEVSGLEYVPENGPLLMLGNHPGLSDTIALFSILPRTDVRVLALDRPFLKALPNTRQRLWMLPDDINARAGATRAAARYIRDGGAVATFPAGRIEPDPLTQAGAIPFLANWSDSIGLFARLAPEMMIVVALIGGVANPKALYHPLTRLRRTPEGQELVGSSLQLIWKPYQNNVVKIAFAPPLHAGSLLAEKGGMDGVNQAVRDTARHLLENWPSEWQKML